MVAERSIRLAGARQNNLQQLDLEIPHRQWLAIVGPSGSGKTSLAVQTLYAEGQRRYVESFSAYTRQFLDQAEKPAADRIEGVPAAVSVSAGSRRFGRRTNIASLTEAVHFLQALYAHLASLVCPVCGSEVRAERSHSLAGELNGLPSGTRYMIGFALCDWWLLEGSPTGAAVAAGSEESGLRVYESLRELGFARMVSGGRTVEIADPGWKTSSWDWRSAAVVIDRLVAGKSDPQRVVESIETAFGFGNGRCLVWTPGVPGSGWGETVSLDGAEWRQRRASRNLDCGGCKARYRPLEPAALSASSPIGACPACEGFGEIPAFATELIIPDPSLSIRGGAIAPWNSPGYRQILEDLLALGPDAGIRFDVPWQDLTDREREGVWQGVPGTEFSGLNGFFQWLEKRKYKLHFRVYLSRWRRWDSCRECNGSRLNRTALGWRIAGRNLAELQALPIEGVLEQCRGLAIPEWQQRLTAPVMEQLVRRLEFLCEAGLGQLSLDRPMSTLSAGQIQRVVLACALSSRLVNMLYVLDEPMEGLHPENVQQVLPALQRLHRMPNTLVIVDRSRWLLESAERVIELGPEAGESGGKIVFDGSFDELLASKQSPTGLHLSGRKGGSYSAANRREAAGWLQVSGARGRNLKRIDVRFPLGCLCVVSGMSGSGKSTLVRDTLYPLLAARLGSDEGVPLESDGLQGGGGLEEVVWMDSTPLMKTARSIPATYIGVYDEIRKLFAATPDARSRNLTAGSFSFNLSSGRCPRCEGEGRLAIDMQFLADVTTVCDLCHGQRFQPGPLEVRYRGVGIHDVLGMTGAAGFVFFRGQPKIQAGLKALKDAGLGYIRLGQPLSTLSRGETQRLKLALRLAGRSHRRTLFLLETPTAGLHMDEVTRMVDGFSGLLEVGHSLVVIEHDLQLISHADWVIDLGPGSDAAGGEVVVAGTPEQVAAYESSVTGRYLREYLSMHGEKTVRKNRKS